MDAFFRSFMNYLLSAFLPHLKGGGSTHLFELRCCERSFLGCDSLGTYVGLPIGGSAFSGGCSGVIFAFGKTGIVRQELVGTKYFSASFTVSHAFDLGGSLGVYCFTNFFWHCGKFCRTQSRSLLGGPHCFHALCSTVAHLWVGPRLDIRGALFGPCAGGKVGNPIASICVIGQRAARHTPDELDQIALYDLGLIIGEPFNQAKARNVGYAASPHISDDFILSVLGAFGFNVVDIDAIAAPFADVEGRSPVLQKEGVDIVVRSDYGSVSHWARSLRPVIRGSETVGSGFDPRFYATNDNAIQMAA